MRIALGVEYNGHDYAGWQAQKGLLTVQSCLEDALTKIADHPITVNCAGRTDAGVHALGQVIHFETSAVRPLRAFLAGTNTHLPSSIAVRWAKEVSDNFHARFSANARMYRYVIYNNPTHSAHSHFSATWYQHHLDVERMQQAANHLLGELDFTSFRSSQCESKTPMRNVHHVTITRHGDFIIIEIQANAFLHHMVRNIVGVLMRIGTGQNEPDWALEVLQAKDRRKAAETAAPQGLYLYRVIYPEEYQLPYVAPGLILTI